MAPRQGLVNAARPIVEALRSPVDIRRDRLVDQVIDNQGNVIDRDGGLVDSKDPDAVWNGNRPLMLGTYHLWVDGSGRLRIKNGKATSDGDGVVIGTQT